ncbi:phosphoenolpyruvate mutase [Rhizosaccharibacter radicis]|uniref:phosphoenolpyruvate mutase n=1 Tax=Rhizosaccharibacter radicis TaxID=2782605 RepID=A0ABT1W0L6_9PROT|nr:phosphoenolpyruvate mutase [Acetobacteraceae bacterium KSS12]
MKPDAVMGPDAVRGPDDLGSGTSFSVSPPSPPASRFRRLRDMLRRQEMAFLMEAHSGVSAKIAEEAGFEGIWGSGLSMSAALGLRDNNEASWTQVLDQVEYMADATTLPILLDGDTGYGNFNNVRRLVRKLCERGVAGVCLEDKLFPKTNSFIGEAQPLADIHEFAGRLRAAKDSQPDDDFCVVARVEALISGHSMDEAIRRAEAYHAAGADAILIHSKKRTAHEIAGFMERWGDRCPVVIVPTMYYGTPTAAFRKMGVSTVIWANHLMRSSITAMRETAARIQADQHLGEVEGRIASVKDIFSLMNNDELEEAGARYLPVVGPASDAVAEAALAEATAAPGDLSAAAKGQGAVRAVVLAASRGEALGTLTADRPKCMLDVRGRPLLAQLIDTLHQGGVRDVAVVRGFAKDAINPDTVPAQGLTLLDNDRFDSTGELGSLLCAESRLQTEHAGGDTVVVYGDVLFRRYILDALMGVDADIAVAVDALRQRGQRGGAHDPHPRDLVLADKPFSADYLDDAPATLRSIGAVSAAESHGEWIGLLRLSPRGAALVRAELDAMRAEGVADAADIPALLSRLAAKHPVAVHYITGHWIDVDTLADLADARNFS